MVEKENLQTRYDHLASQLAAVELENDELKHDRDENYVEIEKQNEVMASQEEEIEILKSQVCIFKLKAHFQV